MIVFESLKQRRSGTHRTVPVPSALLETPNMVHGIRELHYQRAKGHAQLGATAIYTEAVGAEEKDIASKISVPSFHTARAPDLPQQAVILG